MSQQTLTLTYLNEDDRSYGLAGMAISLASLDAVDRVASLSLDSDDTMITFSHEYYFSGSPSISPKSTWDNLIRNFYITSAMAVGNVAARSLVRLRQNNIPAEVIDPVIDTIYEEGRESCSLEDDEIEAICDKVRMLSRRIFGNPRIHPAVDELARTISRRRSLSGGELIDELRLLQII